MDKNTTLGSEKIRSLFDAGTFVEIGAYVRSAMSTDAYDGLVCGYGSVRGKLVFAFAQDMDRQKGALDAPGAKKLRTLYNMAMKNGAPVVGLFDSAGAVVYDGTSALDAYAGWMRLVSDASGVIPQIAVICGVCASGAAVVASMFDFIVTIDGNSSLYMVSPFLAGEESAGAKAASEIGLAALNCADEAQAFGAVATLIDLLPMNNCDHSVADAENPARAIAAEAELSETLLDCGTALELYASFAPELKTVLGRLGGETVGLLDANGPLTPDAARKAARMISFCDAFNLPVVTLVNSEGVEVNAETQTIPAASVYARLATAYASANCAKISVVTGKAYGLAYSLLASREMGADLVLALPEAIISTMAPDKAVAFVWNDKITEDVTREMVEQEWIDTYAKPEMAAAEGDVDDVIAREELRMRLCSAVYMLSSKAEGKPARRHPTLAL